MSEPRDSDVGGGEWLRVMELTAEEARVVGALVEKQLTTPQQYPLTLNALVSACNQASSRNPVVSYDERTVESTLAALKEKRLVRFVHPSHGRSVTRYRQVLEEVLSLGERQLALVSTLMLRGPQTAGELRGRTERMADFTHLHEVEEELEVLASREPPLVTRLPREPGRKEVRYAHLLAGAPDLRTDEAGAPPLVPEPGASLAAEVEALRAQVEALRRDVDDVRAQLGL